MPTSMMTTSAFTSDVAVTHIQLVTTISLFIQFSSQFWGLTGFFLPFQPRGLCRSAEGRRPRSWSGRGFRPSASDALSEERCEQVKPQERILEEAGPALRAA